MLLVDVDSSPRTDMDSSQMDSLPRTDSESTPPRLDSDSVSQADSVPRTDSDPTLSDGQFGASGGVRLRFVIPNICALKSQMEVLAIWWVDVDSSPRTDVDSSCRTDLTSRVEVLAIWRADVDSSSRTDVDSSCRTDSTSRVEVLAMKGTKFPYTNLRLPAGIIFGKDLERSPTGSGWKRNQCVRIISIDSDGDHEFDANTTSRTQRSLYTEGC